MHFDQRTQRALREVGLETADLRAASEAVVEQVERDAAALEAFFDANDVVYSDVDLAHSSSEYPEHRVEHLDLTTHAADMRGWLRFETWGAYVEDGRVLEAGAGEGSDVESAAADEAPAYVELTLGPTIHDRVRFAADRETLR